MGDRWDDMQRVEDRADRAYPTESERKAIEKHKERMAKEEAIRLKMSNANIGQGMAGIGMIADTQNPGSLGGRGSSVPEERAPGYAELWDEINALRYVIGDLRALIDTIHGNEGDMMASEKEQAPDRASIIGVLVNGADQVRYYRQEAQALVNEIRAMLTQAGND